MRKKLALFIIFTLLLQAFPLQVLQAKSSAPVVAAPASVTASLYEESVQLQWDPVADAVGYKVYRSLKSSSGFQQISDETVTSDTYSYLDPVGMETVSSNTRYYYAVSTISASGQESAMSKKADVVVQKNIASTPRGVRAANVKNTISLTWEPSEFAVSYKVYRSTSKTGPYTLVLDQVSGTEAVDSSFVQVSAPVGAIFYYFVSAENKYGTESAKSGAVTVKKLAPESPKELTALRNGFDISLQWQTNAQAASYKLIRYIKENGKYVAEKTVVVTENSYTDMIQPRNLPENFAYYYTVASIDALNNESTPSSRVNVVLPKNVAPAPKQVKAVNNGGIVSLTWEPSPNAVSYRIYRTSSKNGALELLGEQTPDAVRGTLFTDPTYDGVFVTSKTNVYYAVAAVNAFGAESAKSSVRPATIAPPAPPAQFAGEYNGEAVVLNWSAVSRATGYKIYRSEQSKSGYELVTPQAVSGTTHADVLQLGTVSNNMRYYYAITAIDASGNESSFLKKATVVIQKNVAYTPKSVKAYNNNNIITVSWAESKNAALYNVYRADTKDGAYTLIASSLNALVYEDRTFDQLKVPANKAFYYKVSAINVFGTESAKAGTAGVHVKATPGPQQISASLVNNEARINWQAVLGAKSYNLYRSTDIQTGYQLLTEQPLSVLNYTDLLVSQTVTQDTYYYYAAASVDRDGKESMLSAKAAVFIAANVAQVPENVTASAEGNSISLTWDASRNAAGYKVYRSLAGSEVVELISGDALVQGTQFTDSLAAAASSTDTVYIYFVTAVNAFGTETEQSAPAVVTIAGQPPIPPAGSGASLMTNGDFEKFSRENGLADAWDAYATPDAVMTFTPVTSPIANGSKAQKLSASFDESGSGVAMIFQTVDIEPYKEFTAKGEFKVETLLNSKAELFVEFHNQTGEIVGTTFKELTGTTDSYTKVSITERAPFTAVTAKVFAIIRPLGPNGVGTVYVDAFSFEQDPNGLVNGGYESSEFGDVLAGGWDSYSTAGAQTTYTIVSSSQGGGTKAQKVVTVFTGSEDEVGMMYQIIPVKGNKAFTASGNFLLEQLNQAKLQLFVEFLDASFNIVGVSYVEETESTTGFKVVSTQGKVPANAVYARIFVTQRSTGDNAYASMIVDDLSFVQEPNLLANAGFEKAGANGVADGWYTYSTPNVSSSYQLVEDGEAEGSYAQQVTSSDSGADGVSMLYQDVIVEANKPYLASGQLNAIALNGAKANLFIEFHDANYNIVGVDYAEQVEATNGYTTISLKGRVPANATVARVLVSISFGPAGGSGTVLVDSLKLVQSGPMNN